MNIKKSYQDILYMLECDARMSFTEIGNKVRKSQQTVSYAVSSMQEDDIIKEFTPLFDYTKFGYNGYIVLFRVNTFSRDRIDRLMQLFQEHEMVAWVQRVAGGWDLMIFFLSPNASHFNKEFKKLVSKHPEQLKNYRILTTVVIHDIGRQYLKRSRIDHRMDREVIGGDRNVIEVDEVERRIAGLLNDDPQASSVDMAQELDLTPKTVLERINKMENRRLIKGYRPVIGIQEIGVHATHFFVQYNNQNVEKENSLRDYCIEHPNATMFMKTFGDWDAIIRLETDDRSDQQEIIYSIRERYEEILQDYDTLEVLDDVKKSYLPPGYFSRT
jgi:DNA-binding Lrp family transcriptional regulator